MAHPLYDQPFILYTDASADAFAAVLTQVWQHEDYLTDQDKWRATPDGDKLRLGGLNPTNSFASPLTITLEGIDDDFDWDTAYRKDPTFRTAYLNALKYDDATDNFRIGEDGTLRYLTTEGWRTCVPDTLIPTILHGSHDVLGHQGYEKTYTRVRSVFYWPRMSAIVEDYIKRCPKCIVNKTAKSKPPGNLLPIDVDDVQSMAAFETVGIDFIVGLPFSDGFDAIMVVIDKFTRTGIFIPTNSNYTSESAAELFLQHVVRQGFLPSKVISDRDPKFM